MTVNNNFNPGQRPLLTPEQQWAHDEDLHLTSLLNSEKGAPSNRFNVGNAVPYEYDFDELCLEEIQKNNKPQVKKS
jgi:hypothetical protein